MSGKKPDLHKLAVEYGFAYAFFKSSPDLWDLLQKAVANNWDQTHFTEAFRATKWFQDHSATWRQAEAQRLTDPKTYAEQVRQQAAQIRQVAGQFGINLSQDQALTYGGRAIHFGWNESQITDAVSHLIQPSGANTYWLQGNEHYGGSLSGVEDQLRQTAFNNGINLRRTQTNKWMQQIARGTATAGQYQDYIRQIAARSFPAYSKEIQAGMDLSDVAAPYMQSMASVLELDPNKVSVSDPIIRKALSHTDAKGNPTAMPIGQFEDELRADPRYQYTSAAHQTLLSWANSLAREWGVMA